MNASIMEPEAIINLISQFDDDNGNHSPTFFDCEEDEFFEVSNEEEEVFYDSTDYKEDSHDIAFRGDRGVQQNVSTSSSTSISKNRIMMTATACMAMTSADASKCFMPKDMNEKLLDKDDLYYFDAEDLTKPPKPGHVLHLSIDYQTIGQGEKGRKSTCAYTSYNKVNALLSDLDYNLLVGKSETFNTLACALTTVEKMQRIETLQPRLAWKPLEFIKRTLENTTQWVRVISKYPMKKHHVSRFPWDNRRRLREEVAMDTIFMSKSGFCGSTCEQVYVGLMSRMLNVYPMPSKAQGYILKSYQDFMRYEGVPEGLHRDLAPEEKVEKIINLNRDMMVRDTFAEAGHTNQNPAEALGVKPLKQGAEQLMNRTGAESGAWPWAHKYIASINNVCATPVHGWKTPISVRHGYTPDVSAFLQFQFWEKVYFKVDNQHPDSKEAPGYWMGVSDTVGDAFTYDIWSDTTKKVIQRSAVRSADPNKGGIPNLRVEFDADFVSQEEPEIVEPSNILDDPLLLCPPSPIKKGVRTNKHKVRWHDTQEPPPINLDGFHDAVSEENTPIPTDFGPKITSDDLDQSHPKRRQKMKRACRKTHLLTASACLSLASAHSTPIIDSGVNLHNLGESTLCSHDPFRSDSVCHILETEITAGDSITTLNHEAFVRKMQLQYFDTLEDNEDEDWSFIPTGVLAHNLSVVPRRTIVHDKDGTNIHITKDRHIRVKTCWRNGEVSWVSADALKEQNPWIIAKYAAQQGLTKHKDFEWTVNYLESQQVIANAARIQAMTAKSNYGQKFKFGVQIPMNTSHALRLDHVGNNSLWKDATDVELDSINAFETFKVLEDTEVMPAGYIKIPYHLIYDCKFDGRRKARLVAGGHKTPDAPPEETYSGVVSMDTIRMAFVLSAMNNLEVCAADISTAFLYGKTREKVYIIAGKEFGEHAGKRMIIDKGLYGLKTSSARFHESLSAKLRKMGFRPSKADFDLWVRPMEDHYEYVATYVDDILAFSKDPMSIIEEVRKDYMLKGVGKPEYYLGGNYHSTKDFDPLSEVEHDDKDHHLSSKWLKEGIKTAFSAKTYVEQSLNKLEQMMNMDSFPLHKSPMPDGAHPELDDSPMLNSLDHSKFRSLIGCANWLVTLGRFDIAYAVNAFSRFSMAPRQGHLTGIIRVFGYLKKMPKGSIMIDPKYPDHSQFDVADYDQWKEFYPDVEEMIPGPDEKPPPLGPKVRITVYKDSDHAHDVLTRRSVTGVLLFLNNTPVRWISKRQKTVETSTYGSELVAARIATDLIIEYRYSLRMMGCEPDGPALLLGDNNSVVLNCAMPNSVLKKKCSACAYHCVRKAITGGMMKFTHIPSEMNYADILTKPVPGPQFRDLVKPLLFRVPTDEEL